MPSKSRSSPESKSLIERKRIGDLLLLLRCALWAHADEINSSYVLPSNGPFAHQLDHTDDKTIDEPYEAVSSKLNELISYVLKESPTLIYRNVQALESAYFSYVDHFEDYYTHSQMLWKEGSVATNTTLSDEARNMVDESEHLISELEKEILRKFDALLVATKKLESTEFDSTFAAASKKNQTLSIKARRSACLSTAKKLRK